MQRSYNSRIIFIKIMTYYSQNYADILGSPLMEFDMADGNYIIVRDSLHK